MGVCEGKARRTLKRKWVYAGGMCGVMNCLSSEKMGRKMVMSRCVQQVRVYWWWGLRQPGRRATKRSETGEV